MRNHGPSSLILVNVGAALALLLTCAVPSQAQPSAARRAGRSSERVTALRFEAIRKSPPQMLAFLRAMPKGADLHNHLSGAVYAESYVQWAADKGLCVNQATAVLSQAPCDKGSGQVAANTALSNPNLYRRLIDAWSMRNWHLSGLSGHDQ